MIVENETLSSYQNDDSGAVFVWGCAESGQLGRGNTVDMDTPVQLKSLSGQRIGTISCGFSHSLAIGDSGDLYLWGKGKFGRLGNGSDRDCYLPTRVKLGNKRFVDGACGGYHTAIISSKNQLFAFGGGDKGQLGLGIEDVLVPTLVPFFADKKVSKVACGASHTLVCTVNGELYAFGSNDKGQCGTGAATTDPILVPKRIESPLILGHRIVLIACGSHHSFAVVARIDGTRAVISWGSNDKGQCGVGSDDAIISTPTEIVELTRKDIYKISAGTCHSAAVSLSGYAYTWGSGEFGQLGHGALADVLVGSSGGVIISKKPVRVKQALFGKRIVDIACGSYHTVVLTDKGELYAFGSGDKGQLGMGNMMKNKNEPGILRGALLKEYIFKIAAGGRHNLAATNYLPIIRVEPGKISDDFATLFDKKEFSDIELRLKRLKMKGHKVMLGRSKVFFDLMKSMKEGDKSLKFGDVRPDVLICLIKYLYSDKVEMNIDPKFADQSKTDQELMEEFSVLLMEAAQNCQIPLTKGKAASPQTMFPKTLNVNMLNFVGNPTFADIKFHCPEGNIYAHKAILASRSEKWRAMFLAGFVESSQEVIECPIRLPVFRSLLRYVYTDELEVEPEDSVELLMAANEYGLPRLKQMCEEFVERGIDIDNVAWLYEIADQNDAQQLKKFAFYMLLKEFDAVSKTESYQNLSPQTLEDISSLRKPRETTQNTAEGNKCHLQ